VFTSIVTLRLMSVPRSSLESRAPSTQLTQLAALAARAVQAGIGAADGIQGRYFVSWQDGVYYGDQGHGVANELERRGFRAFIEPGYSASVGAHRVIEPAEATAQIHLATGGWIEETRRQPGAVEIAHAGLGTPELAQERARILAQLSATFTKLNRPDLLVRLDRDRRALTDPALTGWDQLQLMRLHEIGEPASLFVLPLR
jgi:hypothetical protein